MTARLVLRVAPDARMIATPTSIVLVNARDEYRLDDPPAPLRRALEMLDGAGATEQALAAVFDGTTTDALLEFHGLLSELTSRSHVAHVLTVNDVPKATLVAIGFIQEPDPTDHPGARSVLSRFAYLRRVGPRFVLESPRSDAQLILEDAGAATLFLTCAAAVNHSSMRQDSDTEQDAGRLLTALLRRGRFLAICDESGATEEDVDAVLAHWEFHDLLFHSRSRIGRHRNPYGAVFPFLGRFAPLEALPAARGARVVPLNRPDLSSIQATDEPFTAVLEQRRSVRAPGAVPLTNGQLGEFLYRTARVRCVEQGREYEFSNRVYPCGGAAYELEIYVAVNRCEGVGAGLYHYEALHHGLEWLHEPDSKFSKLITAAATMANARPPDVLLLLAARFRRVSWKYRSMAYAGILKNVGVLYQTFYLVATAMGLAPCALGGGSSDLFAALAGTDYYEETSVGEFMISGGAD